MSKIADKLAGVAQALRLCCPGSDWTTLFENYAVFVPEEYTCYLYSLGSASHQGLWTNPAIAVWGWDSSGQEAAGLPWALMGQDKLSCQLQSPIQFDLYEREGKEEETPVYQIFNISFALLPTFH